MDEDDDEEGKLTLDDVPNEILLQILCNIDSKNRASALLVSKRWYILIDELIGRTLFVGRQCQLIPHDQERYTHKYVDISAISQIGVTECFVGEVPEPRNSMTFWTYLYKQIKKALFSGDEYMQFKYPYLLQKLHFDGPIPDAMFSSMVTNTTNVSKLEMHLSSFCCLSASSLSNIGLLWKHLQDLCIWGHRLTDGIFTSFYSPSSVPKNVIALLSNNFRKLSEFSVEFPFDIRDDRDFTKSVLNFLERHTKLLKFKICINIPFIEEQSEFDSVADREWMREARKSSKQLQLKELEIVVSSMRRVRLTKLWLAFIEQQKNLERATILSFRIPASILAVICEGNKDSLKELFVSRILMNNSGRPVQLNCSMFIPCTNLLRLTVEGMLQSIHEPGMILTRLLPKSLVHLDFGGFLLRHQDVRDVLFELPNLTRVCLTDVGTSGHFGVTVEILQEVIRERRIGLVSIFRSVCGQFPQTGLPNGDPGGEVMLKQRPYEIIEFKLNSRGYYENVRGFSLFDDMNEM